MATFWMDTLTVNQRDQAEAIATVQAMPAIFRDAVKTIAVREGDGFYNCCVSASQDFTDWEDLVIQLAVHSTEHSDDVYEEFYLQHLCTLQQCFLSHISSVLWSPLYLYFRVWAQCHQSVELSKFGSCQQGESTKVRIIRHRLRMCEEDACSTKREAELTRLREKIAGEEAQEPDYDLL
jgi:hypothetical protein